MRMIEGDETLRQQPDDSPVPTLAEAEREAIAQALAAAAGNKSKAADFLRIHRNRLARMMRRFSL